MAAVLLYQTLKVYVAPAVRAAEAQTQIEAYRGERLRTLAQMRERPVEPFLTDHWLPAHSVARIFRDSGTYKTFLAIDWAIHLALGRPWHGCAVPGPTRVVWVAGEGEDDIAERIDACGLQRLSVSDICNQEKKPEGDDAREFHEGILSLHCRLKSLARASG